MESINVFTNDNPEEYDVVEDEDGIEPKNVKEVMADEFWINAMQEGFGQFIRNNVLELVPRPEYVNVNGSKLIFKNKSDECGNITRNKDKLVSQGMSDQMVEHFVQQMKSKFEMGLVGELNYFIELQVKQMEDNIFVSQSMYSKSIVKKFPLDNAIHKRTPPTTHVEVTKDKNSVDIDQSLYKSMIGILLYLTTSRPGITFYVGVCAIYQAKPKTSHLTQVKRILSYINKTCDYGIL
ncbi:uncharacterized mitochondrial protein AtMg00810-like [Vicia villosa]|uniref:uncharacterized mitochondrial protein AtMg00810-like n=1 Tax=Vicia villosa TaxID=3911 RepID=UPI00273BB848|nr:uncharacterized mitochondrial protein AtMg00810-like [Vicia villosa]